MPTLNREIYQTEPTPDSILNEGVVDVVNDKDKVLEYELKTFVCSGKYEEGLDKILRGFCENCGREPMPAVWISGFYGSGKSHLLQMLAHLWENKRLPGGAMPRDLAVLPASIKDRLAELDTLGKRNGGLRSATGTLRGENSNDMKMAILKTVFRSCGLPESYAEAKFVLWLRNEGVEKDVADTIAASGKDLAGELGHLYVSTRLHNALCEVLPNTFPSARECAGLLKTQFPVANTVSDTDFKNTLREVLAVNGKLPLTLIVMDEVQEYIGENGDRSGTVQSAVQACSKAMDGRLMLVCSGQSALSGVTMLQKMKDRFDIEIHLGNTDITTVIREVVLRKKPQFIPQISKVLTDNIGEISRQLAGSDFAYSQDVDGPFLVADYPVLPSRRNFWERTLKALERVNSDGQLRNLLKANRDLAYENGGLELGNVVPADGFFFRNASRLLDAGVLSREFHHEVMKLYGSTDPDVKLVARACGLVFLINKVAEQDGPRSIRATVETLADLMVSDLSAGSAPLRAKLPALLDSCPALQKIGSEYHVQTKEGAEWSQEFKAQTAALKSMGAADIDAERMVRIRDEWAALGVRTKVPQGQSNIMRDMQLHFNVDIPMAEKNAIALTVKDEWTSSQKNVRSAAAADGINSPHIHVFVPKRNADRVRDLIIQSLAAGRTIGKRPTPSTPEGSDAKKAIESIQQTADSGLRQAFSEMFKAAVVFQGGGAEVLVGASLAEKIKNAAAVAADRLYPEFGKADNRDWGRVWEKAQKGDADSLSAVGYAGEAKDNPVCKTILSSLGAGKTGDELRKSFGAPPYGWTRDPVDGALGALMASGDVIAHGPGGKTVGIRGFDRKVIGTTDFRPETVTLTSSQQIELRKFFRDVLGGNVATEELSYKSKDVLDRLVELAEKAGGDAPAPEKPDTATIDSLRGFSGNELLREIHGRLAELRTKLDEWKGTASEITARIDAWRELAELARDAATLKEAATILKDVEAIRAGRQLLVKPDPVPPLATVLSDLLRKQLDAIKADLEDEKANGEQKLLKDGNWAKLGNPKRHAILESLGLIDPLPKIETSTASDIISTLRVTGLQALEDKTDALPGKYVKALQAAAKELAPKTQQYHIDFATFNTPAEVDKWLAETGKAIKALLANGPVSI